jgi:hypothetical protein
MILEREIALFLHGRSIVILDEVGTTGNIFYQLLPPTPDKAVAVRLTAGFKTDLLGYDKPGVQILTRSKVLEEAERMAWDIYRSLHLQTNNLTSDGVEVFDIQAEQTPFFLGEDELQRKIFSTNYLAEVRES